MQPVTVEALVKRINRKLRHDGEILRRCPRRSRWFDALARFYSTSPSGMVIEPRIDFEGLARDLGVLRPGERVTGANR